MIGIEKSLLNLRELDRELIQDDFIQKVSYEVQDNIILYNQRFQKSFFVDYAPQVFERLRQISKIKKSHFLQSMGNSHLIYKLIKGEFSSFQESISQGKSGSLFYFSNDRQFILKTIQRREYLVLKRMLKNYYYHILNNKNSMIIRLFGLYKIKYVKINNYQEKKIYFTVFNNLFNTSLKISVIYDLKGAHYKRKVDPNDFSKARKEVNFEEDRVQLDLDYQSRKQLMTQIQSDVNFLQQQQLMDYSLLVGIHEVNPQKQFKASRRSLNHHIFTSEGKDKLYFMSIIDIFTEYNLVKKLETFSKQIVSKFNDISSIPPKDYGARFEEYIHKRVLKKKYRSFPDRQFDQNLSL